LEGPLSVKRVRVRNQNLPFRRKSLNAAYFLEGMETGPVV